jgi:hypothetical protein
MTKKTNNRAIYPHKLIRALVVKTYLKANQSMKECLGIAKGNQTILNQSTSENFTLNWLRVSEQENLLLLDFQIGVSSLPIEIYEFSPGYPIEQTSNAILYFL